MDPYKGLQAFRLPLYTLRSSTLQRCSLKASPSKSSQRFQSYNQFPRRRPQYNRFDRAQQIRDQWNRDPKFRYFIGAGGVGVAGFYAYNLERVPVSGRVRFNCVPASWEASSSLSRYQEILQEFRGRILPDWHPHSKMVNRVLKRLIPNSGLEEQEWEVHVIDDDSNMNAFVVPGGKVFVFSGILPICGGEDGLAAVLGHEIAHNVAHHSAEQLSQRFFIIGPLALALVYSLDVSGQLAQVLLQYALALPFSRKHESEADHIGLLMMAQSCYDPYAAIRLWQRMSQAEKGAPPQFLSTHPSSYKRIEAIEKWLPQALDQRNASNCSVTANFAEDFRKAFSTEPHRDETFW